jgi:Lon protease-like protein
MTRIRQGRSGRLLCIAVRRRASGIDNGLGRDADFERVDTTRCLRLHRRYGERIEPLQASFARANESVTQASDIPHSLMQRIDPMRDFRDAKAMAQTLREALKMKSVSLTHSESLELVATILGFHDWNVLSATIQSEVQPAANPGSTIPATVRLAAENQLPTLPVRDIVLFPHLNVPLFAGRAKTISAVERAMAEDRRVLVVTQRRPGDDNPTAADLYGVGLTASVTDLIKLNDGTVKLLVKTLARATIVRLVEDPFLTAEIAPFDESRGQDEEATALSRAVLEALFAVRNVGQISSVYDRLQENKEPGTLADAVAAILRCDIRQKQDLLETGDVVSRLQKILALMKTEQAA